jgi:enoyl-CoA hydratase/carnithine racemase
MTAQILFSAHENFLQCTLSHPEKKNALTPEMLSQIIEKLQQASSAPTPPRAVVFTGEGGIFSAGYDLTTLPTEHAAPDDLVTRLTDAISQAPFPSIAGINGSAFGAAFDLICACDFRIGVKGSRFVMPPARLGIIYAPRGLARFYQVLGPSLSNHMLLAGLPLSAERAFQVGILQDLVEAPHEVLPAALSLAKTVAQNAPIAVQSMRRAFQQMGQHLLTPALQQEIEAWRQQAFASDDLQEGLLAFAEKRPPRFSGT